jgi:predicted aldo/keto reductase-like oxidoreductase
MLYRPMGKTGDQVSILGYGCMRFPLKDKRIDEERTERQVVGAIEQGVNYFDAAYSYRHIEAALGKILAQGYRDRVLIATKLPLMLINSAQGMERILATSLQRLQTDHIDYYLMHALNTLEGWHRARQLGVDGFLERAKAQGQVRHVGFSYHGDRDQFRAIVDDYPWDFCQIQYNYLDEHFQAGKEGLEYAASKGLGVVVMEPLRGGNLVGRMPAAIQQLWAQAPVQRTPAEWALRWVWNHPEVSTVLSGMNEEAHIEENLRIASEATADSLSAEDLRLIAEVGAKIAELQPVGCTGCGYCMPCPAGVNIPYCFSMYNTKHLFQERGAQFPYLAYTCGMDGGQPSYASLCRDCGVCETKCPQRLPIRRHLREVTEEMQTWYFLPLVRTLRGVYRLRKALRRRQQ